MFNKAKLGAAALLVAAALAGCSTSVEQDAEKEISAADESLVSEIGSSEEMVTYTVVENADTTSIKNGDLEYVPFSDAKADQISEQIGTVQFSESEPVKNVYSVNGQNSDQWIIVASEDKSDPVIYREMSVTEYPEGFVSEYPWN